MVNTSLIYKKIDTILNNILYIMSTNIIYTND